VIPAGFGYSRAGSAGEALSLLAEHGDEAKLLAGGHSLLPLMKLRLAQPEMLIDIGDVTDLSYVEFRNDHVAIGAGTRHRDVERSTVLAAQAPLVAHAASQVGDPQVRNRGTIGGSLAHGDPASDLPSVALASGASMVVRGPSGERVVPAADFFVGFLETAVGPDELLTEIRFPVAASEGWSFQKFNRRAQDWAIVGASVLAGPGGGVALVNVGPSPTISAAATAALRAGADAVDVGAAAADECDPTDDIHADTAYRRHLVRVLVERAVTEARA